MKKMLFKLVTSGIIIVPSCAMIIACGDEEKGKSIEEKGKSIKLVTDGGIINDKSFNEQAFDALKEIYKKLDWKSPSTNADVLTPNGHGPSAIGKKYSAAFNAGAKLILAPGWFHVDAIKLFNSTHGKNKLKFIVADSESFDSNVAGIVYDTKSAGFLAGVLSGYYLKAKNDPNPRVGTFGGNKFPGVTDFMTGWVQGIKWFNTKDTGYKNIEFYSNGSDNAWTNTGFKPGGGKSISEAMVDKDVDIILPVAGPQTADALTAAKKRTGTMVIGVDTNQKLSYPAEKKYLLTSIMKNIKDSLVQVWQKNYDEKANISDANIKKGFDKTSHANLDNKLTGIEMTEETKMMKDIYAIIRSSEVQNVAKSDGIKETTWEDSLQYIQNNLFA